MVEITPDGITTVTQSRAIIDEVVIERWANRVTDDEARFMKELIRRAYKDEDSTLIAE